MSEQEQTNNAIITALGGDIVIKPVFDGGEPFKMGEVQGAIRAAYARADERRAQLDALPPDAPISALREMRKAIKDDDDAARDFPNAYAAACAEKMGMTPLFTQLEIRKGRSFDPACVRGRFKAMLDEIDERIKAATPPAPRHTYVVQVELNDSDMKKAVALFEKAGAAYRYAAPQTDKAAKQIDKWFEENLQK